MQDPRTMIPPGENNIWTISRLRTQLAAQKGKAPAPCSYVVWRATTQPKAPNLGGYELLGEPGRHDEATFEHWLIARDLAGPERLSVSVLVIRENLDETGLLRDCVLERRRGGAEGPYYGNVARVEFAGAAKNVRRYRAARDGRLTKLPAEDDTAIAPPLTEVDAEAFAGEDAAVQAYLGPGSVIVERRGPTLLEDLAGLSGIVSARRRDGTEIGCGVGWHGDIAFVLAAGFARDGAALAPSVELEAAVDDAIQSRDFIRLETRLDDQGFCVLARERGQPTLVTIRLDGNTARVTRYDPGRTASANEDQRRWMTYAETYEARTVLDSWRDGDSGEIAVVTIDQDGEAWRHIVDADGIEVSRRSDNAAAAAVMYRERIAPPELAPEPAEAAAEAKADDWIDAAPEGSVPEDSLLARVLAWSRVTALLRAAIAEGVAGAGTGQMVPRAVLDRLGALARPLTVLNAGFSAGSLTRLITQARSGALTMDGVAAALEDLATRVRDELALTRIVTLANVSGDTGDEPPFGPLVEAHFPAVAYDVEEAVHCLALRRPTASVLHAMQVMRQGLKALERLLSTGNLTGLTWSRTIAAVRAASGQQRDLAEALMRVRRAWREPGLLPAGKYTEEEAAAVLDAVAGFMRLLAARLNAPDENAED